MARITYVEHDGTEHTVEVRPGMSLMEGAIWNNVPGIFADCGGDGGCATCQVYVDGAWRTRLGDKSSKERSTLRFGYKVAENSRLSCYIAVTDDLDGLVVSMPARQF
jgi:2Fe-2S ferredoxin